MTGALARRLGSTFLIYPDSLLFSPVGSQASPMAAQGFRRSQVDTASLHTSKTRPNIGSLLICSVGQSHKKLRGRGNRPHFLMRAVLKRCDQIWSSRANHLASNDIYFFHMENAFILPENPPALFILHHYLKSRISPSKCRQLCMTHGSLRMPSFDTHEIKIPFIIFPWTHTLTYPTMVV